MYPSLRYRDKCQPLSDENPKFDNRRRVKPKYLTLEPRRWHNENFSYWHSYMEGGIPFLSVCAWSFWLPNRCLILQHCTWHLGQMSCKMTPFWDGVRRNNRKKNYFNSCVLSKSQSCWLWRMWRYMYIHKIYHNLNTPKCNPTCNSGGIFNVRLLNWFAAVVFAVRVSVSACPLVFLVSSFSFFIPLQINKKKLYGFHTHTHTYTHWQ